MKKIVTTILLVCIAQISFANNPKTDGQNTIIKSKKEKSSKYNNHMRLTIATKNLLI